MDHLKPDESEGWQKIENLPTLATLNAIFPRYTSLEGEKLLLLATSVENLSSQQEFALSSTGERRDVVIGMPEGFVRLSMPWPNQPADVEVFVKGHVRIREINDIVQGFREKLEQQPIAA